MRRIFGLLLVACCLAASAGAVLAQDFDTRVRALAKGSYSAREKAIERLAETGDARAEPVLRALGSNRLFARKGDGAVFIIERSGDVLRLTDPSTGKEAGTAPKGAMKRIRVNNRLRRAIEAAMGALTLASRDPELRRKAAEQVFQTGDPDAIPALDKAIAAEPDPGIKLAMRRARAVAVLKSDAPESEKLAAVEIVAGRGDQEALAALAAVRNVSEGKLKDAAAAAVRSIARSLEVWEAAQNVWYGLSLGSVLLLAAIGLAITFGVMGVINMAHGEMVMLGAYTTFVVQGAIRGYAPELLDLSLVIAVPAAFLVSGGVGVAIERTIIRFLYGRPLETLLATWGLSLVLQQAVRTVFGPTNREVVAPSWMSGAFELGQLTITYNRLWIIIFALVVFALLVAALRWTPFGLSLRAVTQNRPMASSMGIRTPWVDALTFGLGSGIAGIAGVALSQIDNVSPNLGQSYIIDSFMVVVFGGVGNLWGTLVGATTLGVINKFLEPYAGAVLGKILVLVAIILFIQKRPRGLFALRGRAVES